jgi:hypothetical protein
MKFRLLSTGEFDDDGSVVLWFSHVLNVKLEHVQLLSFL